MGNEDSKTRKMPRSGVHGVQSIEIGMNVVGVFVASDGPLALKEVVKLTGLGPSAVHRYLVSFVRSGLLTQLADQRYDLGPLALRIGFAGLSRIDSLNIANQATEKFVDETGMTAMLSVWSERGPLVVKWRQGANPVFTTIAVGSILPLENSATGQVFLAWGSAPMVRQNVKSSVVATDLAKRVVEAGYAEISGDLVPGLHAVAVPVFDGTGGLVSVLTAVAANATVSASSIEALRRQAESASHALGYRPRKPKG
jgi:DNA-binding IclR family transcriptional regulator